jgi:hypothetical protein
MPLLPEARVVTGSETSRCVRTMEAMVGPLLLESQVIAHDDAKAPRKSQYAP